MDNQPILDIIKVYPEIGGLASVRGGMQPDCGFGARDSSG